MIYLALYWSFFQIGLFTFGGGYAALPLIKTRIVDLHGWLTPAEFTDIVTISQMTPGPIGINAATFVGTRVAGIAGAVIATLGCVTPSFIIVLGLAYLYKRYNNFKIIQDVLSGLRPAVVGLIAASGLSIVVLAFWPETTAASSFTQPDWFVAALFAAGFFILRKWKVNPIYIMLGTGLAGLLTYLVR